MSVNVSDVKRSVNISIFNSSVHVILLLSTFQVMRKLQTLFQGYSSYPPIAFVFMGTFLSTKYGSAQVVQLKSHFKALGDMIATFPNLVQHSKFIFVPGPTDPACANILPRYIV